MAFLLIALASGILGAATRILAASQAERAQLMAAMRETLPISELPAAECKVVAGDNSYGDIIGALPAASAQNCCNRCGLDPYCNSFTYLMDESTPELPDVCIMTKETHIVEPHAFMACNEDGKSCTQGLVQVF